MEISRSHGSQGLKGIFCPPSPSRPALQDHTASSPCPLTLDTNQNTSGPQYQISRAGRHGQHPTAVPRGERHIGPRRYRLRYATSPRQRPTGAEVAVKIGPPVTLPRTFRAVRPGPHVRGPLSGATHSSGTGCRCGVLCSPALNAISAPIARRNTGYCRVLPAVDVMVAPSKTRDRIGSNLEPWV